MSAIVVGCRMKSGVLLRMKFARKGFMVSEWLSVVCVWDTNCGMSDQTSSAFDTPLTHGPTPTSSCRPDTSRQGPPEKKSVNRRKLPFRYPASVLTNHALIDGTTSSPMHMLGRSFIRYRPESGDQEKLAHRYGPEERLAHPSVPHFASCGQDGA